MFFADHLKSVQSVVEKAMLDAKIERSLKTYEEIWLSKIFELQVHARSQLVALATVDGQVGWIDACQKLSYKFVFEINRKPS